MQVAVEVLLASIFIAWFIASILNQFQQLTWFHRIRKRDHFSLLPAWTFFAPNPGRSDYRLVYRDKRANGSVTQWREIPVTEPRRRHSFVWNPEKRGKKVLGDIVASCATTIPPETRFNARPVMLTLSYIIVLNAVCQHDRTPDVTHRQFLIVETAGFRRTETPRILLRSDFHAMVPGRAA